MIDGCVKTQSGDLRVIGFVGHRRLADHEDGEPSTTSCRHNETAISWNQAGSQGLPGKEGAPGPQGLPGPSDAFSVERADEFTIPTGPATSVLRLTNVPAGNYVVLANIVVGNLNGPETIPVVCFLASPTEASRPYAARIDPFSSAAAAAHTASGASTQTIALALTTVLSAPGDIVLRCQSNTGTGNAALGGGRQITAIKVANLHEDDSTP